MRWYVSRNGETVGPVEEAQVAEWVRGGLREGMVRDDAGGPWTAIMQSPFALLKPLPSQTPRKKSGAVWILLSVLAVPVAAMALAAGNTKKQDPLDLAPDGAEIRRMWREADERKAARDRGQDPTNTPPATATTSSRGTKVNAWVMAEQFVRNSLKSPSSADFGGVFSEYQNPERRVEDLGDGKYRARGWVDAQNGFGAKVRSDFVVTVQDEGGGRWQAIEGPTLTPR